MFLLADQAFSDQLPAQVMLGVAVILIRIYKAKKPIDYFEALLLLIGLCLLPLPTEWGYFIIAAQLLFHTDINNPIAMLIGLLLVVNCFVLYFLPDLDERPVFFVPAVFFAFVTERYTLSWCALWGLGMGMDTNLYWITQMVIV